MTPGSILNRTLATMIGRNRAARNDIYVANFGWVEGNPIKYLLRFILFGEGDIPVVTREVLRKAEKEPSRRPVIHVGG